MRLYNKPTRDISPREYQVIHFVAAGLKNREVGAMVGTTEHVIKNYLRAIYDKLGLWNRVELALWYESRQTVGNLDATSNFITAA